MALRELHAPDGFLGIVGCQLGCCWVSTPGVWCMVRSGSGRRSGGILLWFDEVKAACPRQHEVTYPGVNSEVFGLVTRCDDAWGRAPG